MKPRMLAFLMVFCVALGFLVADGLCTTAKRVSADGKELRHISEDVHPPETMDAVGAPGRYSTAGFKDESDCYNLIPDPDVSTVTEHDLVGTTWYEFQKNGSMGRMISVTSAGTGGYRHVSWMWSAGVYPGTQRRVYARSKPAAGVWSTLQEVGLGTVNSGYCNQTHLNDGTSVVIFHRTGIGGNWSYLGMADVPAADPLYARKWDLPDEMPEGASGEVGAWPKCEVLYCIDSTINDTLPIDYIHIIENEGNTVAGAEQWIAYLRCYVDPTDVNNLKCQTPTTYPEVYNIPANTAFQDQVYGFGSSCDISAVVATGRGIVGKKVAIPYMPLVSAGDCDQFHNVGYIVCLDNGAAWLDGTDWPPTTHIIADYTGLNERAFHDLSDCYDYEDSLHIVWTTCGFDPANPGFYQPGAARLYHWSKKTNISLVASKIQEGANPAAHNLNLSKVSISPKDPIYHPGGDTSYVFCAWTQVDSSDQNAAGDQGNQDLFVSGSFNGGNTWGKVYNITGTHTPGCVADACVSEHWPSMATNMEGGDLHIEYICDRDAGGAIMDEGAWTENYVMYMRLPEWTVEIGPRFMWKIIDPPHWWHPPIKALPGQARTIRFRLYNTGGMVGTYSVSSDHPCIQVSVPPTQLAPKDSIEIPVLLDGTGACNGTFIAGNVILTTDEAGGMVVNLRVHAVVADDYYECPRDPETVDTLENDYIRMYVNANCQQWIHDIGWDYPTDTTHEVFFQGGTIVATTSGGDTLVGRFMGENDMRAGAQDKLYKEQCEPDWEPHFWILFTKEIYIEASHLNPPNHFKWFWWEIAKQIKFFKSTAPEYYQRIVIKYVKVKRQDPPGWWPDLTPFTDYEDTYIGFAMDIDAPFDTSGPETGDEGGLNYGRFMDVKHIAYVTGFGREHPGYNNYHAGIALAEGGTGSPYIPYGTANVKNNQYLYPQSPWGWKDGELCQLAAAAGNYVQDGPPDPDSIVDRTVVLTASKIFAGTDPGAKAEFALVEVLAPTGEDEMVALVDTGRAIVARERQLGGLPAACGDVQGDFVVNVGDVVYLVSYLYKGGPAPYCPQARGDVNDDGVINVGDVVYLVTYLYKGGPPPNCPGIWAW
jgi:hypothetical protein